MAQTDKERRMDKKKQVGEKGVLGVFPDRTVERERQLWIRAFDDDTLRNASKLIGKGKYAEAETLLRGGLRDIKEVGESPRQPLKESFETMLIEALAVQDKIEEAEEILRESGNKNAVMIFHLIGAYGVRRRLGSGGQPSDVERARELFDDAIVKYDALIEERKEGLVKPPAEEQTKHEQNIHDNLCLIMETIYFDVRDRKNADEVHQIAKRHGWTES